MGLARYPLLVPETIRGQRRYGLMQIDITTAIGFAAAIFSTTSFAPQAWKIIKTRQTGDLSLPMYVITVLGFALWLGYGALLGQWPLVLSNGICFLLSGFILVMKLAPRRVKERIADTVDPNS